MNTQDLARAVALAKEHADGLDILVETKLARALIALHSHHAAMVGELIGYVCHKHGCAKLPHGWSNVCPESDTGHRMDPEFGRCDWCDQYSINIARERVSEECTCGLDTILSQHVAEGKEEGRG